MTKKLCPFMSDANSFVYCREDCALYCIDEILINPNNSYVVRDCYCGAIHRKQQP